MEVIWTQEALERLKDIQYYLSETEKAPQAAQNTLERIFAREPQIRDMPLSGRIVPDYHSPHLRELLEGSYRIIYLIQSEKIQIVSVMHQSRLLTKIQELEAAADAAIRMLKEEEMG